MSIVFWRPAECAAAGPTSAKDAAPPDLTPLCLIIHRGLPRWWGGVFVASGSNLTRPFEKSQLEFAEQGRQLTWLMAIIFLSGGPAGESRFNTTASTWEMERPFTSRTGPAVSPVRAGISPTSRSVVLRSTRYHASDATPSTLSPYADRLSPKETVERALQLVGRRGYDLLFDNCEHFAAWCVQGSEESRQVHLACERLGAAGVKVAIGGCFDRPVVWGPGVSLVGQRLG